MVNFEIGPQNDDVGVLVDTGADKSYVTKVPTAMTISKKVCKVQGAKGETFEAQVIEYVEIRGNSRECIADFIYIPKLGCNLLGQDLQVTLGIGVTPKEQKMVVQLMVLRVGDLDEISPSVWAREGKLGCLNIPPIKVEMQKDIPPIQIRQYPISSEGREGLTPVINQLLKEGILEACRSPHNIPILAVKKADGKYQLISDLSEVNERTMARHPVVQNPYIL